MPSSASAVNLCVHKPTMPIKPCHASHACPAAHCPVWCCCECRAWAWTLWKAEVLIPKSGPIQLVSRAVDAAYNTQPDNTEPLWNLRGVVNNAWHRVDVTAL